VIAIGKGRFMVKFLAPGSDVMNSSCITIRPQLAVSRT